MTGSVLFHVQYLLGVGHLQRSLRIAEALADQGADVTLVSGGPPAALPLDPRIRFVQLSAVRALDARFALVDSGGQPIDDDLRTQRRNALLAAFSVARPHAVVIEGYPFARRAFRFELQPLIAAIRETDPRPRLICSLRDILVARSDPARDRAIVEQVRRDFDAVLVHGDPSFVPLDASFAATPEIAGRLVYTGYVAPPLPPAATRPRGEEIVISAGGGAAGLALLTAAVAARRLGCLADSPWRLVTGTHLPEADFTALRGAAPPGLVVERFRADFTALLRSCRVSVSQAGYNTVLDILRARARAVLVPFSAGRETEQLLRAERLAALGAVQLVREGELSPARLAAAIERAAAAPPPRIAVDMDGAGRSAAAIREMIAGQ